tara:strand:+ start:394 stop:636 length:243 start_codon:yes stop_codon:yes gene_type:complete
MLLEVIMEQSQESEKVQLSTEQLVEIANSLQQQVSQMDLMIKDLGAKVAQKEVENSQLKAIVQSIRGAQSQADDGKDEEE